MAVANESAVNWSVLEKELAVVVLDEGDEVPVSLEGAAGRYVGLAPPREARVRLRRLIDNNGQAEVTTNGSNFWPFTPTSRGHEAWVNGVQPLRISVVGEHLEVERQGRLRWFWPVP